MNPIPQETRWLDLARQGDREAFSHLVEPFRRPLLRHCYRLSGCLDDAEDVVQETFLRAWHKLPTFSGKGSFKNWLYVISTRLWLDEVRKRKKQVLVPLEGAPADPHTPPSPSHPDSTWLDPFPSTWLTGTQPSAEAESERRDSVSLAFLVTLQTLNPRQRVVLILREVMGWRAEEVAEALGVTVPAVHNLLYRARKQLPHTGDIPEIPEGVLDAFVEAWESGDLPSLIHLLHDRVTLAMPPMGVWYRGRRDVELALENFVFLPGTVWKLARTEANGLPAFGIYQGEEGAQRLRFSGLLLPEMDPESGELTALTAFLSPALAGPFRLPSQIERGAEPGG